MVWLDGCLYPNAEKQDQWEELLSKLNNFDILFKKHHKRDCIYEECHSVILSLKDSAQNVAINQKVLELEKMPRKWGLYENNTIIYRNNDATRSLLGKVFEFMQGKSYRDQLALTYILWKNKYTNYLGIDHSDMYQFVIGHPVKHLYISDKTVDRAAKRRHKTMLRRLAKRGQV